MVFNSDYQILKKLQAYKMLLVASLLFLGLFTFWQGYSALKVHQRYQSKLMENVVDRVSSEYQLFLSELQLSINEYQHQNLTDLHNLYDAGEGANKDDYMALLTGLRNAIPNVRLFSLISPEQVGTVAHITGDFLPDCKEEIASTFSHQRQEELFLHRSASSMHFDLLIPLLERPSAYLFVAFNGDELQALLSSYSLPYQELFLLRNDQIGAVELTNTANVDDVLNTLVMTEDEVRSFNYSKPIKNTRWNIAIKLSEEYRKEIFRSSLLRALALTCFFAGVLYLLYRVVSRSTNQLIKAKDYIYKQQSFDALTGAYSKYKFIKSLNNEVQKNKLDKKLCISLQVIPVVGVTADDEEVNQADFYLKQLANTLMELLGEHYTYGRISKSVIAVYSDYLSEQTCKKITEKLDHLLLQDNDQSNQRFSVKLVALQMGEGLENAVQIVKAHLGCQRDTSVYSGQLLTGKDAQIQALLAQDHMLNLLLNAIKKREIVLYFQEIHSLRNKRNDPLYEILVRLKDGEQVITPNHFIPLAEQSGLIIALDKAVISKTLEKMSLVAEVVNCSINLSGKTITDPSLKSFITNCLEKYHVSPEHITFEITETDAVNNFACAQKFIEWATQLGCKFALDDFGKGLSSFSYLQQLPIDKLKIDGCFIRNVDSNKQNFMFVKTMTELAHNMELEIVAECAENQAVVDALKSLNVDYVQGYVMHKPEQW